MHKKADSKFVTSHENRVRITCTLTCIIENAFVSTYFKKKNGNLILKVAVDVVSRLDLQRK